jgi:hypothetical protein
VAQQCMKLLCFEKTKNRLIAILLVVPRCPRASCGKSGREQIPTKEAKAWNL